jgi:general secretion pathway protein H
MAVFAVVALAAGLIALAIRDPAASRLQHEAARLSALLDAARAESRASGLMVRWVPQPPGGEDHFRFVGLPTGVALPRRWLDPEVRVEDGAAQGLLLGPEPVIGAQRIVLRLADQRIEVRSDGLGPFEPGDSGAVQ